MLTSQLYWKEYWKDKKKVKPIKKKLPIHLSIFHQLQFQLAKVNDAIELGGFPGINGIYLKKRYQIDCDLLDYYIVPSLIETLYRKNNLDFNISCFKDDMFDFKPEKKYDMVFSMGLLEHFVDITQAFKNHIKFLKKEGYILIVVPNLKGLNGNLMRVLDRKNYKVHNLKVMDIDLLLKIAQVNQLTEIKVGYFGSYLCWTERKNQFLKLIFFSINVLLKLMSILMGHKPKKYFSPYLFMFAKKSLPVQ